MNYSTLNGAFGAQEFSYSEYFPRQATNELSIRNNNVRSPLEGVSETIAQMPRDFNDTISARNSAKQLLNLDFNPSNRFSRVEASQTAGMYPQQGYARNQPLGLAFDPQHPLNLPVMPIAGYYDLTQKNILGNLM
jgi:hypothetical protein